MNPITMPVPGIKSFRMLLCWLLCPGSQVGHAQQPGNDTVYFVGSSITRRFATDSLFAFPTANLGVDGLASSSLLALQPTLLARNPNKVVIEIGINDLLTFNPNSLHWLCANVATYVSSLQSARPGCRIWLLSMLPANAADYAYGSNTPLQFTQRCLQYNQFLWLLAAEKQLEFVDVYPQFLRRGQPRSRYYHADLIHPNPTGYQRLAKVLKKALK